MGIQMLNGIGGIQPYYRTWEIPTVKPEAATQQMQQEDLQTQPKIPEMENDTQPVQVAAEDNRSRMADLENISLTFNKEESYDYIGSQSGLADLDMQKAISDMRKDQMLQEYQYFVGTSNALLKSADGVVIPKQNF